MNAEHVPSTALDVMVDARRDEDRTRREDEEKAARARFNADAARLALAELAEDSVKVVAARLMGLKADDNGVPIDKEREDTAWEVLSRIGVPKLRATALAASITAAPRVAAPGSPGWEPPALDEGEAVEELDPASVDAQIEGFLAGAFAAAEMAAEGKED